MFIAVLITSMCSKAMDVGLGLGVCDLGGGVGATSRWSKRGGYGRMAVWGQTFAFSHETMARSDDQRSERADANRHQRQAKQYTNHEQELRKAANNRGGFLAARGL